STRSSTSTPPCSPAPERGRSLALRPDPSLLAGGLRRRPDPQEHEDPPPEHLDGDGGHRDPREDALEDEASGPRIEIGESGVQGAGNEAEIGVRHVVSSPL